MPRPRDELTAGEWAVLALLAEAPSHGIPAMKLEQKSKGALAYLALAGEMMRRMEARGLPTHATTPNAPDGAPADGAPPAAPPKPSEASSADR